MEKQENNSYQPRTGDDPAEVLRECLSVYSYDALLFGGTKRE
jgi:hypothetical protein